jgi:hypothetical protein
MHIDPIHAGPVALAQALALASRADNRLGNSRRQEHLDGASRRLRFEPLRRLANWWQRLHADAGPGPDPMQLMLWSEWPGRSHATALGGLLLMNRIRGRRSANQQRREELR